MTAPIRFSPSSTSFCLPRWIIPRGGNKESLTKSESVLGQAVFLFPRDAVSNAFLKANFMSLSPPDGLFRGEKELTCPPRLRWLQRIIPGTTERHRRSAAIPPQKAPPPPPTDAPSPAHHAPSPPTDHSGDNGASTQDKRPSRPEHPAPRPLPR